jgi:hypothetical protein
MSKKEFVVIIHTLKDELQAEGVLGEQAGDFGMLRRPHA